jgi:molybdopterin adenylyltransferase
VYRFACARTGGTGFAPRDVTPEATKDVLDTELTSLMPMVLQATAINAKQPLATLSRATAGIKNNTVVANLPGNPKSIEEIMPVLFPQLLHALVDVRGW